MEDLPAHLLPLYEARKFSILFEELQVLHPTKSISQISDCIQHLKSQFFSSFDTSFRDSIVASIRQSLPDDLRNSSSVNRAWNQRNGNHLLAETNEEELTLLQESLPPTSVKLKFSLVPNQIARTPAKWHAGDRMQWIQNQNLGSFYVHLPLVATNPNLNINSCWIRSYYMTGAVSGLDTTIDTTTTDTSLGATFLTSALGTTDLTMSAVKLPSMTMMHGLCSSTSTAAIGGENHYSSDTGYQFVFVADGKYTNTNLPASCRRTVHINGNINAPLPVESICAIDMNALLDQEYSTTNGCSITEEDVSSLLTSMIQLGRLRAHRGNDSNTTIKTWRTNTKTWKTSTRTNTIKNDQHCDGSNKRHEFLYDSGEWDINIVSVLPPSVRNMLECLIARGANRIRMQLQLHSNDSLALQRHYALSRTHTVQFDHAEHLDVPRSIEHQDRICVGICVRLPEGERQQKWELVRKCHKCNTCSCSSNLDTVIVNEQKTTIVIHTGLHECINTLNNLKIENDTKVANDIHLKWHGKQHADVLNVEGVYALVSAILQCHDRGVHITMITMIGLNLDAKRLTILSDLFIHPTLKIHHLNLYQNNLGDKGADVFAARVLSNVNCRLVYLKLSENDIGSKGVHCIANSLRKTASSSSSIEFLKLGGNPFSDDGVASIVHVLHETKIRILKLSRCGITDKGARLLVKALTVQCQCQLEVLRLGKNLISEKVLVELADLVVSNSLPHVSQAGKKKKKNNKILSHLFPKMDIEKWATGYGNIDAARTDVRISHGARHVGSSDVVLVKSYEDFPQSFRKAVQSKIATKPVAYYKSSSRNLTQLKKIAKAVGYVYGGCTSPDGQLLLRLCIASILQKNKQHEKDEKEEKEEKEGKEGKDQKDQNNMHEIKDTHDKKNKNISDDNIDLETLAFLSMGVLELLSDWEEQQITRQRGETKKNTTKDEVTSSLPLIPVHCTMRIYDGSTDLYRGATSVHQDKGTTEWNKDRVCIHASSAPKFRSFHRTLTKKHRNDTQNNGLKVQLHTSAPLQSQSQSLISSVPMGCTGFHWMTSNIRTADGQKQYTKEEQIYHDVSTSGVGITFILTTSSRDAQPPDIVSLAPVFAASLDRLADIFAFERRRWYPLHERIKELSGRNVDEQILALHSMERIASNSIKQQIAAPPTKGSLMSQTALRQKWQAQVWTPTGISPMNSLLNSSILSQRFDCDEKEVDDTMKKEFREFCCNQVALSAYVIRAELKDLWNAFAPEIQLQVRFHAVLTMRRYAPEADLDQETGHNGKWTIHSDSFDGTSIGFSLMSNKMGTPLWPQSKLGQFTAGRNIFMDASPLEMFAWQSEALIDAVKNRRTSPGGVRLKNWTEEHGDVASDIGPLRTWHDGSVVVSPPTVAHSIPTGKVREHSSTYAGCEDPRWFVRVVLEIVPSNGDRTEHGKAWKQRVGWSSPSLRAHVCRLVCTHVWGDSEFAQRSTEHNTCSSTSTCAEINENV